MELVEFALVDFSKHVAGTVIQKVHMMTTNHLLCC